MTKIKQKIIVILGPTASGKTSLGVRLSDLFNGEIISADSRQVYRGMDIGTGKDLKEYFIENKNKKILHHLIDIVNPRTEFNLAKYCRLAEKAIVDIASRNKLPIIVGGTGLYVQAVVDGYGLSKNKANTELRQNLEKLSVVEVFLKLKKVDAKFADNLNNSEKNNKRHLIRYIENRLDGGSEKLDIFDNSNREFLVLGITRPKNDLENRIKKRLDQRLEKEGMVEEVKSLHKSGVSWKRLESFGLEYKFLSQYLRGAISYSEMRTEILVASRQFAKRQMTWFRRWEKQGQRINWVNDHREANKIVSNFLKE